ncbi:MAG: acetate--CoA ligase family protein [Candidatus Methanofastidiosia archaeon]
MNSIIKKAMAEGRPLLEYEAKDMLKEYGISVPDYKIAKTEEEAVAMAKEIGFPIVMKIISPKILHKSDAGCVKVGIENAEEASSSFRSIMENAKRFADDKDICGVLIYGMVLKGVEVIVGMIKDPQFGSAIMFGLGGIFVEVLKDVSFRITPLERRDAEQMIKEIKAYPILTGIRGEKRKDIEAIVDLMLKVSRLVEDNPEIKELDLNPVFVFEKGISVVDARMIL